MESAQVMIRKIAKPQKYNSLHLRASLRVVIIINSKWFLKNLSSENDGSDARI